MDGTPKTPMDLDTGAYTGVYHQQNAPVDDGGVDLRAIWRALVRSKWILMLCLGVALVLGYALVNRMEPRFRSASSILIEGANSTVVDIKRVVDGIDVSSPAVASQVEIIRSEQLIRRMIKKLRLDQDPEFNPKLTPKPKGARDVIASYLPPSVAEYVAPSAEPGLVDEIVERDSVEEAVIAAVQHRLKVFQTGKSFVIAVEFESANPRKAALIANTIADQYIIDQLEAKFEATQRATIWLNDRVAELKRRVEAAEAAVEEFKASRAIVDGQGIELTKQQLGELNSALIAARTKRAEAEARYGEAVRALKAGSAAVAASDVLSSPIVLSLRGEEASLLRNEAELSTRYGPRHPRMLDVRAKLTDTRRAIDLEVRKIVESLRSEVTVAKVREENLADQVAGLERKSLDQGASSVKLRQLEREAESSRLIFQNFLSRFKETSASQDLQQPDARIIAFARPPLSASYPNKKLILALFGALGLGVGVFAIFLIESANNTFRTMEQFERQTGLPVLASVPSVGRRQARRALLDFVFDKPNSVLAEAVRNLRTSLLLANVDEPPKVVLVTSSQPREGKSTLALVLAATTARMGKKAIIVDCDLRRPTAREVFEAKEHQNIVAVVSGQTPLEEAVVTDPREERLCALVNTSSSVNPADILSSNRFANVIERLRESYDLVVIDSPPTLAVTDARILGKLADTALYVTKWDSTPRDAVKQGIRQLQNVKIPLAGTALTMVDPKRQAREVGYDYYTNRYRSYYTE